MRMGRASRARKLATAAAYGGGGLGAATAGFVGVLVAEAQWARRAIGLPTTDPHEADGVYAPEAGSAPAGPPITVRDAGRLERRRSRRRPPAAHRRGRSSRRGWPR